MVTSKRKNVARTFQRNFLKRIVILTGNTDASDGILPGAAAQAVRAVETDVLLFFFGKEHVRELRSLFVLGIILAHVPVDLVRRLQALLTEVVRKRAWQSALADLLGQAQGEPV